MMSTKPKFALVWSLSGGLSVLGIVLPLLVMQFLPVHDNEFGANQRDYDPVACHIALLLLTALGVVAGVLAARKRSKWWLLATAANALLFTAEYISGGYS